MAFLQVDILKTMISWNCALENGVDLYVIEGQKLSKYRVSFTKRKEKIDFDRIWFSRKMATWEGASSSS